MWPTIATGKPSPRTEIVYNVEPFRAGIREGDWKLDLAHAAAAAVELYNIAQDPAEKNNVAAQHPEKVATLEKRVNQLARESTPPLLLKEASAAAMKDLFGSVALPPRVRRSTSTLRCESRRTCGVRPRWGKFAP